MKKLIFAFFIILGVNCNAQVLNMELESPLTGYFIEGFASSLFVGDSNVAMSTSLGLKLPVLLPTSGKSSNIGLSGNIFLNYQNTNSISSTSYELGLSFIALNIFTSFILGIEIPLASFSSVIIGSNSDPISKINTLISRPQIDFLFGVRGLLYEGTIKENIIILMKTGMVFYPDVGAIITTGIMAGFLM